jgi:hypothetical protein
MHEAELSSSEDDTLDDLYDEDDVDGEAELDDDHGDNLLSMGPGEVPDDATTDGDDVCVHSPRPWLTLSMLLATADAFIL